MLFGPNLLMDFGRRLQRGTQGNTFGGFTHFHIVRSFSVPEVQEGSLSVGWIGDPMPGNEFHCYVPLLEFGIAELIAHSPVRMLFLRVPVGSWEAAQLPVGACENSLIDQLLSFFNEVRLERRGSIALGEYWRTTQSVSRLAENEVIAISNLHPTRTSLTTVAKLPGNLTMHLNAERQLVLQLPGNPPVSKPRALRELIRTS